MYHKYYFTILALLSMQAVRAQSQPTEMFFSFDSNAWDKPLVTKQYLVVDGHVLKVVLTDTAQKRMAEFIRLKENAYYYTETDSLGNTLAEGKALLDKAPFKRFKMSLFDSLGNKKGYHTVAFRKFSKTGGWTERVTENSVRHGRYVANKKAGKWIYVKGKEWGYIEKSELYHFGNLVASGSMNLLETRLTGVAANLIGQWGITREAAMRSDTLVYLQRIKSPDGGPYASYFTFAANGNCQVKIMGHHNRATHDATWKIDGNNKIVTVSIPKLKAIICIDFVTPDILSVFFQNTQ